MRSPAPGTVPAVDIEEFYDADPRRRASAEIELGTEWRDAQDVRYELSWVQDTGELYVMREPVPGGWADPFGGVHVSHPRDVDEGEVEGEAVIVLGTVPDQATLEEVLEGWQEAMGRPQGIAWLADRLRERGILTFPPGSDEPAGMPSPGTG